MPYAITKEQEPAVTQDESTGIFVVEASDLGLRPGMFPYDVIFKGVRYFHYINDMTDSGEDLAGVRYRSDGRHGAGPLKELLIIND